MASRFVLPLPGFVLHPLTSVVVCVVHIYLAIGHLGPLAAGDVQWTHIWKGFGALAGAYVFAALASHRMSVKACRVKEEERACASAEEGSSGGNHSGGFRPWSAEPFASVDLFK